MPQVGDTEHDRFLSFTPNINTEQAAGSGKCLLKSNGKEGRARGDGDFLLNKR